MSIMKYLAESRVDGERGEEGLRSRELLELTREKGGIGNGERETLSEPCSDFILQWRGMRISCFSCKLPWNDYWIVFMTSTNISI